MLYSKKYGNHKSIHGIDPVIQGGTLFGKIVPPTISEEYIVNKGNEILNEILSELWISHTSEIILYNSLL